MASPTSIARILVIRDSMKGKATAFIIRIDDKVIYDSRKCLIVWDDAKNMFHAVRSNSDIASNATAPICMESVGYDKIENIDYFF
ncbi:MAG: hypothetical protein RSC68_17515 [Acinetobacter sp.]